MPRIGLIGTGASLAVMGVLAAGCAAHKASTEPGAAEVTITLTDGGCAADPATVPAGPVTFTVTNKDADAVTEAELKNGETILGEKENLTPGLSGTFSLRLGAGTYTVSCPDAATPTSTFTVTGTADSGATLDPAIAADLDRAVDGYKDYVIAQVNLLVPATAAFTDAVRAGDIAKAKTLFAPARAYYETIEPVAESFGDLDPDIDARINDVDDPSSWTGFHRIEKALWQDNSLAGMTPIADKLDADVARLKSLVATADYQPAQLANGATELLNEVATSKITGEEDRYSHTDLSDFQANVDGAKKAFDLLTPALTAVDPTLAATITQRFSDVDTDLRTLAGSYAGTAFVDYRTVGAATRTTLTQEVDALADALSQVSAKVNG